MVRLAPAAVVVVVDVLRFSTTVTDAVARGDVVSLDDAFAMSANGARVAVAAGALGVPPGASISAPDGDTVAAATPELPASGATPDLPASAATPDLPVGVTTPDLPASAATPELPAGASTGWDGPLVLLGCLRNAGSVAAAVGDEQRRRGQRISVAVIAAGEMILPGGRASAGERSSSGEGSLRFAVEDCLGAGAIVDALAALGIDHSSPEAAAAGEAFRSLRIAVRHLLAASGSGQELNDRGLRDEVLAAAEVNATSVVPVLRGGRFVAL